MTGGQIESPRDAAQVLGVNFQAARRLIDGLEQHPRVSRARALAAYVAVFDLADERGVVTASTEQICEDFEISRPSWLQYRAILADAGLIEVDARRGGVRRGFRLLSPL